MKIKFYIMQIIVLFCMFIGGIAMISYIHLLYGNFAKIFYLIIGSLITLLSAVGIGVLISMIYEIKKGK